jgi:hypothetical protein
MTHLEGVADIAHVRRLDFTLVGPDSVACITDAKGMSYLAAPTELSDAQSTAVSKGTLPPTFILRVIPEVELQPDMTAIEADDKQYPLGRDTEVEVSEALVTHGQVMPLNPTVVHIGEKVVFGAVGSDFDDFRTASIVDIAVIRPHDEGLSLV